MFITLPIGQRRIVAIIKRSKTATSGSENDCRCAVVALVLADGGAPAVI